MSDALSAAKLDYHVFMDAGLRSSWISLNHHSIQNAKAESGIIILIIYQYCEKGENHAKYSSYHC